MNEAERILKDLELQWRNLEEALNELDNYEWEKKAKIWMEQHEIEQKMYYLIEEYPELECFITIKIYEDENN